MKILVTGSTAKQIGSKRAFQIMLNSGTLVQALQEAGHEVDWRGVEPGEDLSGYDKCIAYLGTPGNLNPHYLYGALWVLSQRPDAAYALDDWQVKNIIGGSKNILKKPENFIHERIDDKRRAIIKPHEKELLKVLEEFQEGAYSNRLCFTPMFKHGNPEALGFVKVKKHVLFDPTSLWYKNYSETIQKARSEGKIKDKQRAWVHASLTNKERWVEKQNFSWPVLAFGNKARGQERVPENELILIIAENWGLLSAVHNNASSGWFRVRFPIAAACDSILFGDSREMTKVYGHDSRLLKTKYPRSIEQASDDELKSMAQAQKDILLEQAMAWSDIVEHLDNAIKE